MRADFQMPGWNVSLTPGWFKLDSTGPDEKGCWEYEFPDDWYMVRQWVQNCPFSGRFLDAYYQSYCMVYNLGAELDRDPRVDTAEDAG